MMALLLTENSADIARARKILDTTFKGDLRELKALVQDSGLSVNFAVVGRYSGMTPLHIAACKGYKHIVEWIIHDSGVKNRDVNVEIKESKYTPLHAVISDLPVNADAPLAHVRRAALSGALSEQVPEAMKQGMDEMKQVREEMVEVLLSTGDTNANAIDSTGMTPLHLAAKGGHAEVVKHLLEWRPTDGIYAGQRIDLNAVDTYIGNTALHFAAGFGHAGVVEELLKDSHGGHGGLQVAPSNKKSRATPLHQAILFGHNEVVGMLLNSGAPVNQTACNGYTPLHFAVFSLHSKTVKFLLQNAKDLKVSERDWQGWTPSEFAKQLCQTVPNEFTPFTPRERIADILRDRALRSEPFKIKAMVERVDVASLENDKQGYINSINAILVSASLIATVAFSAWLQPPLAFQFATDATVAGPASAAGASYALMEKKAMQVFWVFNCLAFFFSIATVVTGVSATLPKRYLSMQGNVEKLKNHVILASILLLCALTAVIGAFSSAGFVDLPPGGRYSWYMAGPLLAGGLVCGCIVLVFFKSSLDMVKGLWE